MGRIAADLVRGHRRRADRHRRACWRARSPRGDDEIDHLYHRVFAEVVDLMRDRPGERRARARGSSSPRTDFERIGDRVTNIAEDVVYLATGRVEDLNP